MVFGAKSLRIMRLCVDRGNNANQPKVHFQHLWNVVHVKDWIVDAQWLWPKEELPGEVLFSFYFECCSSPNRRDLALTNTSF